MNQGQWRKYIFNCSLRLTSFSICGSVEDGLVLRHYLVKIKINEVTTEARDK